MITQYTSRKRLYWKRVSDRESKRAKRGWIQRHKEMATRPLDADTVRYRALQDRKGKIAAFMTLKGAAYIIRHSKRRIDSYDAVLNGTVVATGGRSAIGLFLGSLLP